MPNPSLQKSREPYMNSRQMYSILFVSQALLLLSINTVYGSISIQEYIPAAILAFFLNLAAVLPTVFLFKRFPKKNIPEIAQHFFGKTAWLVHVAYILYFLCMGFYYLSFFMLFVTNIMSFNTPLSLIAVPVVGVSVYAAQKGLEAIGRTSLLVGFGMFIGFIILLGSMIPKVRFVEFVPFFENGLKGTASGSLFLFSRSVSLVFLGFLPPVSKGKKRAGFLIWNITFTLLAVLIVGAAVGSMGQSLDHWLFPIYSASAFAQTGLLQSMDALFVGMWIFGLVTRLSMDMILGGFCYKQITSKGSSFFPVLFGVLLVFFSLWICENRKLQEVFFTQQLLLMGTILLLVIIPIILLIASAAKGRNLCSSSQTSESPARKTTGKKKKALLISESFLIAISCLVLTSCQEVTPLSQRLLIRGIGIDHDGEEYAAVLQVDKVEEKSSSAAVYTAKGNSVLEALRNVTFQSGRLPQYSHNLTVAFGEKAAEIGLSQMIDIFLRSPRIPSASCILVCEGTAEDVLSAKRDNKTIPVEDLRGAVQAGKYNGQTVSTDVASLVNCLQGEGKAACVPFVRLENSMPVVAGSCILDEEGRQIGRLDPEETRGYLLLTDTLERGYFTVKLQDDITTSIEITKADSNILAEEKEGHVHIIIETICNVNLDSLDGDLQVRYGEELYEVIEKAAEKEITENMEEALCHAVFEKHSDIFRFGRWIRKQKPKYWESCRENWARHPDQAKYTIQVHARIERVGKENTPSIE